MQEIVFQNKEFEDRLALCQKKLSEKGLSGMVVTNRKNLYYYANFGPDNRGDSYARATYLLIPAKGRPLFFTHVMLESFREDMPGCIDMEIFRDIRGATPAEIAGHMEGLGMHKGKVGFELGYEMRLGCPVETFLALRDVLIDAEFVDISDIIWQQRFIKSETEIACLRRACDATSYAHEKMYETIHAGMTEREIARVMCQLMIEGGADQIAFIGMATGNGNYGRIHGAVSNRVLENGDYFWMDAGAIYNGYFSDFSRCGEVGGISADRKDTLKLIEEITFATADQLKPGVPLKEITRFCADLMNKHDIECSLECGRIGHGVGLMVTEPPSLTLQDETILEEGMFITIEPGNITEHGIYVVEENFLITKTGSECLSGGSRDLHLIKA